MPFYNIDYPPAEGTVICMQSISTRHETRLLRVDSNGYWEKFEEEYGFTDYDDWVSNDGVYVKHHEAGGVF